AIEDRQAVCHQVRRDDLPLSFAPEEERRIAIGVVERCQPLVWARERRRSELGHAGAPTLNTRRSSPSTYNSSGASSMPAATCRQNSRARGSGLGSTAHER